MNKRLTQRADGRYQVYRHGKYFYGKTQAEAKAKADAYSAQESMGLDPSSEKVTVSQYAEQWLRAYKSNTAVGTYNQYASLLNDFSLRVGADLPIRKLTTTMVQMAYAAQAGKSDSHIHKYTSTIKSMLSAAVADGILVRNPAQVLKAPNGTSGTHRALEPWEMQLVRDLTTSGHSFALAAMIMLYAGLRRGEVIALDIDRDVDFSAGTLTVREAADVSGNAPKLKSTKTYAGLRTIPLLDPLREALTGQHGLVIHKRDGGMCSQTSFREMLDSYLGLCESKLNGRIKPRRKPTPAGWQTVSFRAHDFRHTYCTMLYTAGVDIKTAMRWMGHADEKMILKIYAHLTEEKEKAAFAALNNLSLCQPLCQNVAMKLVAQADKGITA